MLIFCHFETSQLSQQQMRHFTINNNQLQFRSPKYRWVLFQVEIFVFFNCQETVGSHLNINLSDKSTLNFQFWYALLTVFRDIKLQGVFISRRVSPLGKASPSKRARFHIAFTWKKAALLLPRLFPCKFSFYNQLINKQNL